MAGSENRANSQKQNRGIRLTVTIILVIASILVGGFFYAFTKARVMTVDELKAEGDWEILAKYAGFEFDDAKPKESARTKYDNIMYLERPGCNLCMGNQEKAEPGDTVIATSTRLFQGRVVADSEEKKGESLLGSTPLVVLSAVLGRFPTMDEYKAAVEGINLTDFAPPSEDMAVAPKFTPDVAVQNV